VILPGDREEGDRPWSWRHREVKTRGGGPGGRRRVGQHIAKHAILEKGAEARHQWLTSVILATYRDQEDRGLKPAPGNSLQDLISKNF
jgi:hypothetical protein